MFLSGKKFNAGLLLLRIGIGLVFIGHGYPKLMGGPERWEEVGGAMSYLGIDSYHIIFGFFAGAAELFGGVFLILGFYMLPTLILLICTMVVALISQIATQSGYPAIAHPLSLGIIFVALLFIGPGKYSIDYKLSKSSRPRRSRW